MYIVFDKITKLDAQNAQSAKYLKILADCDKIPNLPIFYDSYPILEGNNLLKNSCMYERWTSHVKVHFFATKSSSKEFCFQHTLSNTNRNMTKKTLYKTAWKEIKKSQKKEDDLPGLSRPWEPSVRDTLTCNLSPVVILGLNSLKSFKIQIHFLMNSLFSFGCRASFRISLCKWHFGSLFTN